MAPDDKLFIDKLVGGQNWRVWKYQIQAFLEARELCGHVDGSVTSPDVSVLNRFFAERQLQL